MQPSGRFRSDIHDEFSTQTQGYRQVQLFDAGWMIDVQHAAHQNFILVHSLRQFATRKPAGAKIPIKGQFQCDQRVDIDDETIAITANR